MVRIYFAFFKQVSRELFLIGLPRPRSVLCYSEQELEDLQTWRREVTALISNRIAAYDVATSEIRDIYTFNPAGSRIAGITELVEQILRYAHPVTRLIALGVCRRWREIALYIIEQDVCLGALSREPRCPPVRLHDTIPSTFARPSITWDEVHDSITEHNATDEWNYEFFTGRRPKYPDDCDVTTLHYLPGRITGRQGSYLFEAQSVDRGNVRELSYIGIHALPESPPRSDDNIHQWIDLSQFEFNPLFTRLFDDQIPTASIAEITLPPRNLVGGETGWQHIPEAYLEHLNLDLLTHPPIVSLNISIRIPLFAEDRPCPRRLLHITNIKNKDGIRIGELLSTLKKVYSLAIEHWIYWAKALLAAVNNVHWNEDIWTIDSAPKLCLSMGPGSEQHSQSSYYLACIYALPCRDQRQVEWMPESMFRHARLQLSDTKCGKAYTQVPGY
ncbi:hypothetical protein P154DRAFT_565215 [Amniculicola lignicola CBS 123094]|uniref:F-box domain-containing protein n=1 Tax=Amniculicola lignicola CBS 123094 TaxID=1392246 RepID=A0A6A5WJ92_9PLEO|nr:hypothetical protein P154DRAFT_565215 [Amniculicola lignicola CBS 123094]